MTELRTDRMVLRHWRDDDLAPFAEMNADPGVMEFFPDTLKRAESDELASRVRSALSAQPFGFWAVEIPDVAPFIGFVGLSVPRFDAHFTPCVEVGWRLARPYWNRGYATEGATAAVEFGFSDCNLHEIFSFTVPHNRRSRRVMEKIGMHHNEGDDFDHPVLPAGHPLRRHVLYRLHRSQWRSP